MTKPATEERVAHTPTPFKLVHQVATDYSFDVVAPHLHGGVVVAHCGKSADPNSIPAKDAAFIVTACNAHEALVDALRAATLFINHRNCMGESERLPDVCACGALQVNAKCRTALSLATPKARDFQNRFDDGREVKPISFQVKFETPDEGRK